MDGRTVDIAAAAIPLLDVVGHTHTHAPTHHSRTKIVVLLELELGNLELVLLHLKLAARHLELEVGGLFV